MIFSEVYSAYYTAVSHLISKAIDGELNDKNAVDIIKETAFNESFVYILDNIKSEQWQIITRDYKTPIKNKPEMPLTTLQKRFIKTISVDPRFKLFCDKELLELYNIEPLYSEDDFYFFDRIKDGDPYTDSNYIKNFRTVLRGLKEHKRLKIVFRGGKGLIQTGIYTPRRLEYSEKDDKFRLLCLGTYAMSTINLARIKSCELGNTFDESKMKQYYRKKEEVILQIINERNALERCMLHFANFQKETRRIENNCYEMKLTYFTDDETEVLIRILSFGPMVKVLSPQSFIDLIIERLKKQKKL
ncbi:MAG TPA: WYL domain-containing protein [Clostridiales bacterium]|nr:WYL domain-containing protein [Clostridiales bacterium]